MKVKTVARRVDSPLVNPSMTGGGFEHRSAQDVVQLIVEEIGELARRNPGQRQRLPRARLLTPPLGGPIIDTPGSLWSNPSGVPDRLDPLPTLMFGGFLDRRSSMYRIHLGLAQPDEGNVHARPAEPLGRQFQRS